MYLSFQIGRSHDQDGILLSDLIKPFIPHWHVSPDTRQRHHGRLAGPRVIQTRSGHQQSGRADTPPKDGHSHRAMVGPVIPPELSRQRRNWECKGACMTCWFDGATERSITHDLKLYGLAVDLNITDKQYLIALTVFFFPYALFEVWIPTRLRTLDSVARAQPASNILLRRFQPSIWLSSMMFMWGVVMVRVNFWQLKGDC